MATPFARTRAPLDDDDDDQIMCTSENMVQIKNGAE